MLYFDSEQFRKCFPAIHSDNNIYLDSAATALKPTVMINETVSYLERNGSSVQISLHAGARLATAKYESARLKCAKLINSKNTQNVVWTKGTTESISMIAQYYVRSKFKRHEEIIISEAEHHSNIIPWLIVAKQTGVKIINMPLDVNGIPRLDLLPTLVNKRTKLIAITQMSNVTGWMPDLDYVTKIARSVGAKVAVDGAQGIVHSPPDLSALDIDFYSFSAHKLFGPSGVGVLYLSPAVIDEIELWQGESDMFTDVSLSDYVNKIPPFCFETGTPNITGIIGFNATLEWLEFTDYEKMKRHSSALADYADEILSANLKEYVSYRHKNSSILSFNVGRVHHADFAKILSEEGVSVRSGTHSALPLIRNFGVSGTLRASFAAYNNFQDVERFTHAARVAVSLLK